MLKIEEFVTPSPEQWEIVIKGMRNPKNSWDRMDSTACWDAEVRCVDCEFYGTEACDNIKYLLGPNDRDLANRLVNGGPVHAKFRRMLPVHVTIDAPLYWWKEFETYRVGVCPNPTDIEINSCSTMHKIHSKEFTLEDFSTEHLIDDSVALISLDAPDTPLSDLMYDISKLNTYRTLYLKTKGKEWWWQMIQRLPTNYNQKRTVMLNYEVLANIYQWRRNHKLDEWHVVCDWIEKLPYSELITGKKENE